jgi:hypothetical protein
MKREFNLSVAVATIVKYGVLILLLAGWISCGQEQADTTLPEEPYAVAKIENLQTRLRILDPDGNYYWREHLWQSDIKDLVTHENMWRWDPKNVIVHFPPQPEHYRVDTYFGYADADGQTLLCETVNFPEAALQWKEDFSSNQGNLLEVNVQMSGTVRLYTDDTGKKYGTLELASLKPSESEGGEPVNLQLGVYTETYPGRGRTLINFIDKETLKITQMRDGEAYQTNKWRYEIRDNYTIRLTEEGAMSGGELFFRVISDSKFEWEYMYIITAEHGLPVMTFEKENNSNN